MRVRQIQVCQWKPELLFSKVHQHLGAVRYYFYYYCYYYYCYCYYYYYYLFLYTLLYMSRVRQTPII